MSRDMGSKILELIPHHPITVRTASRPKAVQLAQLILEVLDTHSTSLYDQVVLSR